METASVFSLRQTAKIEEIPEHTQLAFVHTEDKRFYAHHGFDSKRIVKAIWNNCKAKSFKEGASTISQQLIKNTHLTQEKTIQRKLKECKLTAQLEANYSKQEILEKYLNSIYFGHNCFGIQSASAFYFGKQPSELTLADSAILAGLVKSPNNYSPFKNPEKCQQRKEIVLSLMVANGSATQKEKEDAMQEPLPLPNHRENANMDYLHFVFDELTDLTEKYALALGGKIEIHTALDPVLQAEIEELSESIEDTNKSMLVLDVEKKTYKACVSDVGNICRLPGSIIKPLLVYGPSIEENELSPATPILDEKVNYGGYAPENFDGSYHGYVSMRESVAKSLNIPAVKVLQTIGFKKATAYMEKLRLPIEKEDESLALALGGMRKGFSLQNLANAYATFPNQGEFIPFTCIEKMTINGKTVYQRSIDGQKVFSKESAYLMTDVLKSTAKNGTAKKLRSLPFDVAAKTGTAKKLRTLPFDIAAKTGTVGTKQGNTDAYAIGYTTKDLVAVWLGNADNTTIPHTGGGLPCNYLFNIHEYLYNSYKAQGKNIPSFPVPNGVACVEVDKASYYDTHTIQLADNLSPPEYRMTEWFKKEHLPTKTSHFFSNPSISPPKIDLLGWKAQITFDRHSSPLYTYQIDRYDYATHITLYKGPLLEAFIDPTLEENKRYIYTITPSYNGRDGIPISLPAIQLPTNPNKKEEILETDWWQQ